MKIDKATVNAAINSKLLTLFGFAMKAGKLETGADRICDEIRRHGVPSEDDSIKGYSTHGIVIIASNASDNTKKRIVNACKYYRVEFYHSALSQSEIADRIGKASVSACATFDRGFADGMRKAIALSHISDSPKAKF